MTHLHSLERPQPLCADLLIPLVLLVLVCPGEGWAVDESVSSDHFTARGIPDPGHDWSVLEFATALEQLEKLPETDLPRAGAEGNSGLLFSRLISERRAASPATFDAGVGRSIVSLYARANKVTENYWVELLIAWQLELSIVIEPAMRYADIEQARREAEELFSIRPGPRDPRWLENKLRTYESYYESLSSRLKEILNSIVLLGASPDLTKAGRAQLVTVFREGLLPACERLSPDDQRWIVALVEALGRLPSNIEAAREIHEMAGRCGA